MEKSQSSNQLAGNKYWSFKSKFRRSQSTTPSLGSTFYLTEEVVVGNESSSGLVGIIFSSFNFVICSLNVSIKSNVLVFNVPVCFLVVTVHLNMTLTQHTRILHLHQVNGVDLL